MFVNQVRNIRKFEAWHGLSFPCLFSMFAIYGLCSSCYQAYLPSKGLHSTVLKPVESRPRGTGTRASISKRYGGRLRSVVLIESQSGLRFLLKLRRCEMYTLTMEADGAWRQYRLDRFFRRQEGRTGAREGRQLAPPPARFFFPSPFSFSLAPGQDRPPWSWWPSTCRPRERV